MKVQKMKKMKRTMVAGLAAFMMLAESVTAFAAEPHDAGCGCGEEHGAVILYDEQFVDEDGNITPVSGISAQVFCFGHRIVEGYFQTHVADGKGGCVVKTYHSTKCVYCDTVWVGALYSTDTYAKCPHDNIK
nr:hypothetical protein [uncultured Acetatifactor sp.]